MNLSIEQLTFVAIAVASAVAGAMTTLLKPKKPSSEAAEPEPSAATPRFERMHYDLLRIELALNGQTRVLQRLLLEQSRQNGTCRACGRRPERAGRPAER